MDDAISQGTAGRFIMGPDHEQLHRQASRLAAEWVALPFVGLWRDLLVQQQALDVHAGDYSTHRADLQALQVLQDLQDDWQLRFRMALESRALSWRNQQRPKERSISGLTLMSELELAVQLESQQSTLALQKALAPQQEALDARVRGFAYRLGLRQDAGNPWGVEAVVQAFSETLPLAEFSPTLVPLAFRAMRERMEDVLREAWDRLLAVLENFADPLAAPSVTPVPEPVAAKPRPTETGRAAGPEQAWMPEGGLVESLAQQSAAPEPPVAAPAQPPSMRASEGGQSDRPSLRAVPSTQGSPLSGSPEAWPMPRYRDIVHERLSQWRQRAQHAGAWLSPTGASVPHVFRASEVITVASMLQGEDPGPFSVALGRHASVPLQQVVREQMLKAAGQFGFDPENASFSPDEEDAIDLVSLLFTTLARQNDLMPRGERMLGKLVMPYVKVAMLDDSLFNRRVHPARRLLDALAETCDGNAGETLPNREMLDRADRIVDELVARFQEDQAIFELAAQELRDFLDQQRKRAELSERRLAEALHGRERLQFARRAAHQAIVACIGARPLSVGSFAFMENYLHKALVQAWLRHGEDSPRYRALVALGGELSRLDAYAARLESHALAQGFAAQLDILRECLSLSGHMGEMAEEAVARLLWQIADPQAERILRDAPPLVTEEAAGGGQEHPMPQLRVVGGTDSEVADPTLVARVRKLRVGQGLRILEDDGRESAARVAWISPLTSRFLIVNRRGVRRIVATAEGLAQMVERGHVSLRAIDAPVDHAMRRIWEEIAPQAGAA